MAKYIMVLGGCLSGVGKGISAASIGMLLKHRGHTIQCIKFDGYLNSNSGVLSPREHGESWVCDDGSETDLDLGHYERIIGIDVSCKNILTSGTLYKELLEEESEGKYLGKTLQVNPHITNKIQDRLIQLGKEAEIVIVEVGGTIGDLESAPYVEAIRQFKQKNWNDVLVVMVSPIIWLSTVKEHKTKPLQQSVIELQRFGLQADILLCRTDKDISSKILDKISDLTNVAREAVFNAPDVKTVYQVPIEFYNRHIDDLIADKFHLKRNGCRIHKYRDLVEKYVNNNELPEIKIGIVGKYDNCDEAYLSLKEAIYHAAVANDVKVNIVWISAEELETNKTTWKYLEETDGVIIPGGFDNRGIEGKIRAIKYTREKKIPFLGICLGLQCAVIEISRNLCGFQDANSMEFDRDTKHPVVHFVAGQENLKKKSGTMRLGAYDCEITNKDSIAYELYKKKIISERHRHRYEINQEYLQNLASVGCFVTGQNPQSYLVEIMELSKEIHPFFIGTQAHPEFKSRLGSPAPLFDGFINAAARKWLSKDK